MMPKRVYAVGAAGVVLLAWGAWQWAAFDFPLSFRAFFDALLLSRNTIDKDAPVFAIALGLLCLAYMLFEIFLIGRRKS